MEVELRCGLLDHAQPVLVVLERPVGMDAGLHADLGGAELDGLADLLLQRRAVVLVGVGRAFALAEAAEGAADDADVRDVDVAADDKGHGRADQLLAELIGGLADVFDRLRARLGKERCELILT